MDKSSLVLGVSLSHFVSLKKFYIHWLQKQVISNQNPELPWLKTGSGKVCQFGSVLYLTRPQASTKAILHAGLFKALHRFN